MKETVVILTIIKYNTKLMFENEKLKKIVRIKS